MDRSKFLALAASIAAATTLTATGCASEVAQGADQDVGACVNGRDLGTSYEEGLCSELAVSTDPTKESSLSFDADQYDSCIGVRDYFRQPIANKVHACLQSKKTGVSANSYGDPLEWDSYYSCIRDNTKNTCMDNSTADTCHRIIAKAEQVGGQTIPGVNDCKKLLSAVKPELRPEIEACAMRNAEWGFGADYIVFSCLEGIDPLPQGQCSSSGTDSDRISFDAEYRKSGFCEGLYNGGSGVQGFVEGTCRAYEGLLRGPVAKRAMDCLNKTVSDPSKNDGEGAFAAYTCMQSALRATCQDSSINQECQQIVDDAVERDATVNNGGRLTKQCRTYMSGLNAAGRAQVKECMGGIGGSTGNIWNCVEGIRL